MGKWAETKEAYYGRPDSSEENIGRVLPILFNTEMVQAILDGRKTVTRRRVKKSQCMLADKKEPHELDSKYAPYDGMTDAELVASTYKPPYQRGDTLYVRETWCNANREGVEPEYYYYADTPICEDYDSREWKWRPSIHMPKEAARIWLNVTDVRVERLQDITGEGVFKEGISNQASNPVMGKRWENMQKMEFEKVWDSTIKKSDRDKYCWSKNPYVYVIEFERCEKPGDGR